MADLTACFRGIARTRVLTTHVRTSDGCTIHGPTVLSRLLQRGVRTQFVRRLYSAVAGALIPPVKQGRAVIRVRTDLGEWTLPQFERSAVPLVWFGYLPHEYPESRVMHELVKHCRVAIDIGAHYGWYTGLLARSNPQAAVFAFEPDPETFGYLQRNLSSFTNVQVYNIAISSFVGQGLLHAGSAKDLNSIVRPLGPGTPTQLSSLDEFCRSRGLDCVDLIKCDVEGAELDVLRGAKSIMRHSRPPIWMLEVAESHLVEAGHHPSDIQEEISSKCGRVHMFSADCKGRVLPVRKLPSGVHQNIFYVPEARLEEFTDWVVRPQAELLPEAR